MSSARSRSIASRTTHAVETRFLRASASNSACCSLDKLTESLRVFLSIDLRREDGIESVSPYCTRTVLQVHHSTPLWCMPQATFRHGTRQLQNQGWHLMVSLRFAREPSRRKVVLQAPLSIASGA